MWFLSSALVLVFCACLSVDAVAQSRNPGQPINRWSIDGMRPNRIERPNDLYIKRPERVRPKIKPVPREGYMKAAPRGPQYGDPGQAIDRIPPT